MKRLLSIAFLLILTLSLTACGDKISNDSTVSNFHNAPTGDSTNLASTASVDPDLLSLTFTLNGATITLPCPVDEFVQKTGFKRDQNLTDHMHYTDGNNSLSIVTAEDDRNMIISISTRLYDDEKRQNFDTDTSSLFLPKNITVEMNISEVEAAYGPSVYSANGVYNWTLDGKISLDKVILRVYTGDDGTVRNIWYGYTLLYMNDTSA